MDKHLPLKTHRIKYKQQPKWITPEIIDAMKTRDGYKSLDNEAQCKIWRNKVTALIKKSYIKFDFILLFHSFVVYLVNMFLS